MLEKNKIVCIVAKVSFICMMFNVASILHLSMLPSFVSAISFVFSICTSIYVLCNIQYLQDRLTVLCLYITGALSTVLLSYALYKAFTVTVDNIEHMQVVLLFFLLVSLPSILSIVRLKIIRYYGD